MLYYPNYTTTQYNYELERYEIIKANFIAGEVSTNEPYSYGIYECNATFSNIAGSFPAFWLISGEPCTSSFNHEIDIVELKHNHSNPTLDNNIMYYEPYVCGLPKSKLPNGVRENPFTWGGAKTFKCVWTQSKIEYWVGTTKLYETINTGQNWYPTLPQYVILSQQVINYNNTSPIYGINTPQTSNFHWVKVREFFLAPIITGPKYICSTATETLDVDPLASDITWQLTPSNLFTTSSGTGKIANISRAAGASGTGTLTYTFQMPSGETFTCNKAITVGNSLPNPVISGNTTVKCFYELPYKLDATNTNSGETFLWESDMLVITQGETASQCKVMAGDWNGDCSDHCKGTITCTVTACGISKTATFNVTLICETSLALTISPNPSSSETTIELVNEEEKTPVENIEWSMDVYDQSQNLKTKLPKEKASKKTISTSDWKDGLYIVRAIIGEKIITEKLWIKH